MHRVKLRKVYIGAFINVLHEIFVMLKYTLTITRINYQIKNATNNT